MNIIVCRWGLTSVSCLMCLHLRLCIHLLCNPYNNDYSFVYLTFMSNAWSFIVVFCLTEVYTFFLGRGWITMEREKSRVNLNNFKVEFINKQMVRNTHAHFLVCIFCLKFDKIGQADKAWQFEKKMGLNTFYFKCCLVHISKSILWTIALTIYLGCSCLQLGA